MCFVPCQVGCHEAGQPVESKAGVVLVVAGDIFTNHVGGQHHNIQTVMETLRGS